MFCKTCGKDINENAVICPHCGCETGKPMQYVQTVQTVQYEPAPQPVEKKENTSALVGFIMSLLGLTGILPFVGSIVGLILGIMGNKKAKEMNGDKGMSTAAIIISAIGLALAVLAVLLVIFYYVFIILLISASTPYYY